MMPHDQVEKIIREWSSGEDVWQGDTTWTGEQPNETFAYPSPLLEKRPGTSFRPLPEHYADEAKRYIAVISRRYPLQLRVLFGLPMWLRFCHTWNETGDRKKAMRAI